MDIKSVIQRHGYQLQAVSGQMNVKHSTLSGMLSGNPTISTLRKIADSINAMNKEKGLDDRCYLAEFFADELPADFTLQSTAQPAAEPASETQQQPAAESASAEKQQAVSGEGGASGLPFGQQQPSAVSQQAIVCPHCHHALVFNIATYEQE